MTDPADHQARMREIEARLEAMGEGPFAIAETFDVMGALNEAPADLRYLLDRVRELEAASGTFIAAVHRSIEYQSVAFEAELYQAERDLRALLPAPETVETP